VPKKILLLRHAEEPADETSLDLSAAGRRRAEQLAKFIPKTFGTPQFVFAAAPSDSSVRCYLTMRALADDLKLEIDGSYKSSEFAALATKLYGDPAFDDATVVVAWTHKELPSLAAYLNVRRSDFPRSWDGEVFDEIYELTCKRANHPKVKRVKQPF